MNVQLYRHQCATLKTIVLVERYFPNFTGCYRLRISSECHRAYIRKVCVCSCVFDWACECVCVRDRACAKTQHRTMRETRF